MALLVIAVCMAGAVVVALLPIADTTVPTVLVTGVVIVFARYTYAGMAKLVRRAGVVNSTAGTFSVP